jgi:hypothetical protein
MATGARNKLTGQIGEHLVSAKLGILGYYATPYSGNVPGFDITAVNSETLQSFPIQIKTSNGGALVHSVIDKWVEHRIEDDNSQYLGDLLELPNPNKIWIMVQLKDNTLSSARYFICTEAQIQEKIVTRYRNFMEKHNYRRPGGGASRQAILNVKDVLEFEDNWNILDGY